MSTLQHALKSGNVSARVAGVGGQYSTEPPSAAPSLPLALPSCPTYCFMAHLARARPQQRWLLCASCLAQSCLRRAC